MFHEPSDVGTLRPIVIRGCDDIIDEMVSRGTLKECVSYPDLPGSLAVQPMYRHITEPMPVTRVMPILELHDVLLRSSRAAEADVRVSDNGESETDPV
jgi:hypothetical protein